MWGQFLLRLAGSSGVFVLGGYLSDLHDRGLAVTSLAVGLVTALHYVSEIVFAPFVGALSDQRGRRPFLVAGPLLSALAVGLIALGALGGARPSLTAVLLLTGASRLLEGLGSAAVVPTTLGLLAEGTDNHPVQRGRQMSLIELTSSGGIALGATLGPLLWQRLHLLAFPGLSLVYLCASLVMMRVRDTPRRPAERGALPDLRRVATLLTDRRLTFFLPAWVAMSAIVGVWLTAQLSFVLTARVHVRGQQFVGLLHAHPGRLGLVLGGYVLLFSLFVVVWAALLGRLPRLRTLLVTASGALPASSALLALNHGGSLLAFMPLLLVGVFLEAGFTPAALAYLADVSETPGHGRGRLMGVYALILGLGQLAGAGLGSLAAQYAYFDGLATLTILLALVAVLSLAFLMASVRRTGDAPDPA